jgi:hypothetical protein
METMFQESFAAFYVRGPVVRLDLAIEGVTGCHLLSRSGENQVNGHDGCHSPRWTNIADYASCRFILSSTENPSNEASLFKRPPKAHNEGLPKFNTLHSRGNTRIQQHLCQRDEVRMLGWRGRVLPSRIKRLIQQIDSYLGEWPFSWLQARGALDPGSQAKLAVTFTTHIGRLSSSASNLTMAKTDRLLCTISKIGFQNKFMISTGVRDKSPVSTQ